jgi:hypothetical protein
VAEDLSQESFDARQALDFSKLVSALTENIIIDFPSFTSKISSLLCRLVFRRQGENSSLLSYHVIAVVAFFAQIVTTETNIDVGLIDTALEVLLAHVQHVEPNVRIICVQVRTIYLKFMQIIFLRKLGSVCKNQDLYRSKSSEVMILGNLDLEEIFLHPCLV